VRADCGARGSAALIVVAWGALVGLTEELSTTAAVVVAEEEEDEEVAGGWRGGD